MNYPPREELPQTPQVLPQLRRPPFTGTASHPPPSLALPPLPLPPPPRPLPAAPLLSAKSATQSNEGRSLGSVSGRVSSDRAETSRLNSSGRSGDLGPTTYLPLPPPQGPLPPRPPPPAARLPELPASVSDALIQRYKSSSSLNSSAASSQNSSPPVLVEQPESLIFNATEVKEDNYSLQPNRESDPPSSLYQQCLNLGDRLLRVSTFEHYLEDADQGNFTQDPVQVLWHIFRAGAPLCALINALRPKDRLDIKDSPRDLSNLNTCKASVYHFILACKKELHFKEDELFTITELYQDDTNGFVNVIRTVSAVLDRLESLGLLSKARLSSFRYSDTDRNSTGPIGNREKVVSELLETERKYVADLEILQAYMRKLQQADIVSPETILNLFANLNSLVDFQRRFLIGVEANAQLPSTDQRFGAIFVQMEDLFSAYEPFCANYSSASELAVLETQNLMKLSHVLEPTYALPALLIKPIQRICKYPLLVNELIKYTDSASYPHYDELLRGREAIKRVADRVNEERRKEENVATVQDLERRVEDWKGHSVDSFGALLLSDKFIMATNDMERELHVFLFEKIFLCCKESGIAKKRSGGAAQFIRRATNSSENPKRASLQLKGRIFITSVTGVVNYSKNGQYILKVFWRDFEMESFSLKCRNEEQLKLWKSTLSRLVEASSRNKDARG